MTDYSLLRALMYKFEMEEDEAQKEIEMMKQAVLDGQDPEEVLYEYGLEPDYVFEIL